MEIDTTTEFGERVAKRLAEDRVVWLTTVSPDGAPQPSPVWFFWDGETALVYSQPNTPKLRNIAANPRVSLNLNCDEHGGNVIILAAEAALDDATPAATAMPGYLEKYRRGIEQIGMTADGFAQSYSVPIRIRPTNLRGH
jgi:PPOX class probable F420-dependent enzyme